MKRWLLCVLLLSTPAWADIIDLNVQIDECSSSLLIVGPFVREDGITPTLPDTLSLQINSMNGPTIDKALLQKITITPPTCATCTTDHVTATCDPGTGVCNFILPPTANKVTRRSLSQQAEMGTIQWSWALGSSVELVTWVALRAPFLQPKC